MYVQYSIMETVFSNFTLILQTILSLLGCFVIYYAFTFYSHVRLMKKIFKGAKGPENYHWLFGSFPNFPVECHERTMYYVDICNKYGGEQGYVLLWGMYKTPIIVPCSPRIIGKICKSKEPKPTGLVGVYRFIKPWLGEGLIVTGGNKWTRNRRLLTPAFHFEILKPYTTVFNQSADMLVKKLTANVEAGERFEVFQNVCLCTLEIIMKCAFSYNKDVQNAGEANPYVKAVSRLSDTLVYRLGHPLLFFDIFWYRCKVGRQFRKDCDFVHSVAEEIIQQRIETLEKTGSPEDRRYTDFLDILLMAQDEDGQGLTRLEIRNEVDTFLFAGHDTTSSAISWILYSLAANDKCQQRCQLEIDEVLHGRDSDDLEWADLSKLEYLTMCIKEGMRVYAPVPVVSRVTTEDFDLGDRIAPKGTIVQINPWVMNHMENIWGPDHMEFKPERFSKENISKIEPFQYVPFSAGSRNCIGQNFALNEEKVLLSKLLRNFTFRLDPDHEVRLNISAVMRTKDGMYMFAEKRIH